ALDDAPTPDQAAGEAVFTSGIVDLPSAQSHQGCATCHALPAGTDGRIAAGFNTVLKVPHLRNEYQKVGRFGAPARDDHGTQPYMAGDEVRGFGLEFNGSIGSLVDFHEAFSISDVQQRQAAAFVLAFDTGLKPAVGAQVTVTGASAGNADVLTRLQLLA